MRCAGEAPAATRLPVLETCPSYASRSTLSTHCAHRISTCFAQVGEPRPRSRFLTAEAVRNDKGMKPLRGTAGSRALSNPFGSSFARNRTHLPHPLQCLFGTRRFFRASHFRREQGGRLSLGKRSCGGSCDPRLNPSRSFVPECSPVAGAIFQVFSLFPIRCRTSDERFG